MNFIKLSDTILNQIKNVLMKVEKDEILEKLIEKLNDEMEFFDAKIKSINIELDFPIILISGVRITKNSKRWMDWLEEKNLLNNELNDSIAPLYLVRTLDSSNTGYNRLLYRENNKFKLFGGDDQFNGNLAAFQGCDDEDENGNYILDVKGKEWVNELYTDVLNDQEICF